jgi:hypothetical protein
MFPFPHRRFCALVPCILTVLALTAAHAAAAGPKAHYFGPAGFYGTVAAKQITVTKVDKGSPADGRIAPKDVIVAVGGREFGDNPRRDMAHAIDAAEATAAKGVLSLRVKGAKGAVDVQLKVLGTFSETAPFNCPKTDAIVTAAADHLVSSGDYTKDALRVGWLGLMATGEQKYLDVVKRELPKQDWVHPDLEKMEALLRGDIDMGYVCWSWGYNCITLAEYYLMTGDKSVLPGLQAYAVTLARGQDPAGRWGHRLATVKRGGRLPGYSHINQPSVTCFLGMVLARKCGIDHPEVNRAIEACHTVYSRYIGKGALPYGNHPPYTKHFNNNGTSGSVALAFNHLGNKEGARFFSRQVATTYDRLETGHATHYFNILWTPLGAHLAGPEVTAEFFHRSRWLHVLARSWDGRFTFDGGQQKAGNSTGSHLLAYCLDRRALYITGKDPDRTLWLSGRAVADVIGMSQIDYASKSADELLAMLDHWAPQVVGSAVWTLRDKQKEFLPRLITLMTQGTKTQKKAAIGFFGYKCPPELALPRLDDLGAILRNRQEDDEVRAAAASSLAFLGEPAYKYYPDMLRFVLEERPNDPLRLIDQTLSGALTTICADPYAAGLVTDKKLFYDAVLRLAGHPLQGVRAGAMKMIQSIPLADFHIVADAVKRVVQNRDPAYTSYHNPGSSVAAGGMVLAHLNIREGMQWALDMLSTPDGKHSFKLNAFVAILGAYGPNAREMVAKVQADPKRLKAVSGGRWAGRWQAIVKATETQKPDAPLISFEQARQAGLR